MDHQAHWIERSHQVGETWLPLQWHRRRWPPASLGRDPTARQCTRLNHLQGQTRERDKHVRLQQNRRQSNVPFDLRVQTRTGFGRYSFNEILFFCLATFWFHFKNAGAAATCSGQDLRAGRAFLALLVGTSTGLGVFGRLFPCVFLVRA